MRSLIAAFERKNKLHNTRNLSDWGYKLTREFNIDYWKYKLLLKDNRLMFKDTKKGIKW